MAKPKPPEDSEQISIYPTISLAKKLKDLANRSNGGIGVSLNLYIVAVLQDAAESEALIETQTYVRRGLPSCSADDHIHCPTATAKKAS